MSTRPYSCFDGSGTKKCSRQKVHLREVKAALVWGQHGDALIDHIHIAASTCKALMSPVERKPPYPSKCYPSEKVTL